MMTMIEVATKPIDQQRDLLNSEFENWRGAHEQIDDMCNRSQNLKR